MQRNFQDERKEARDQLAAILSFYSRVDAKASALLAINTAMLAVLASNAPSLWTMSVASYISVGVTLVVLAASYWFLYLTTFPTLDGGQQSLIYFREIASRTEALFH